MGYNGYNDYKSYKGYKSLPFFDQTAIIYDFTVEFCQTWIDKTYNIYKGYKSYSRMADQMIQAARSGKQNIAEGYEQKNIESKIHLLKVARGSLEELLEDYKDFLRQKGLPLWDPASPQVQAIRALGYNRDKNYNDYKVYIGSPEGAANAMVCLINQTNTLLDNKIRWLNTKLTTEGGTSFTTRLTRDEYLKNRALSERQKEDAWLENLIKTSGMKRLPNGQVTKIDTPEVEP